MYLHALECQELPAPLNDARVVVRGLILGASPSSHTSPSRPRVPVLA